MNRLFIAIALTAVMSGCALIPDQYACKGMPNDPVCMSTVEAYQATNGNDNGQRGNSAQTKTNEGDQPGEVAENDHPVTLAASAQQKPMTTERPIVPVIEEPVPIRTPPSVMRIWVVPWEDDDGDLNLSGYIYTEIEERRWMIGSQAPTLNPVFKPLQVLQRPKKKNEEKNNTTNLRFPLTAQ